ncbi:hypothetical protein [Nocardia barduliensis]|uniref:hypothetical protein n=1 Tax=Nocardia barduliensis TaxID=2736643 RepID=UPI001574B8A2|nr:hypothetical protein [Nocardia barduliensis]
MFTEFSKVAAGNGGSERLEQIEHRGGASAQVCSILPEWLRVAVTVRTLTLAGRFDTAPQCAMDDAQCRVQRNPFSGPPCGLFLEVVCLAVREGPMFATTPGLPIGIRATVGQRYFSGEAGNEFSRDAFDLGDHTVWIRRPPDRAVTRSVGLDHAAAHSLPLRQSALLGIWLENEVDVSRLQRIRADSGFVENLPLP